MLQNIAAENYNGEYACCAVVSSKNIFQMILSFKEYSVFDFNDDFLIIVLFYLL